MALDNVDIPYVGLLIGPVSIENETTLVKTIAIRNARSSSFFSNNIKLCEQIVASA